MCQLALPAGNTWFDTLWRQHATQNRFLIIISIISGMLLCCKNLPVLLWGPFFVGAPVRLNMPKSASGWGPERGTAAPLFLAHVYCGHGRPSQLLLSSCCENKVRMSNIVIFQVAWFFLQNLPTARKRHVLSEKHYVLCCIWYVALTTDAAVSNNALICYVMCYLHTAQSLWNVADTCSTFISSSCPHSA